MNSITNKRNNIAIIAEANVDVSENNISRALNRMHNLSQRDIFLYQIVRPRNQMYVTLWPNSKTVQKNFDAEESRKKYVTLDYGVFG